MSTSIDYQSNFSPPSEYEHAYDLERGRWLRRRLLWYSGTSLGFGVLMSFPAMLISRSEASASTITTLLVSNAAAAGVFVLAWRTRPIARSVLRIAFLFYVLASIWSIGYSHLTFGDKRSDLRQGLDEGLSARDRADLERDDPAAVPASQPTTRSSILEGNVNSYGEPMTVDLGVAKYTTTGPELRENLVYGAIYSSLLFSLAFNHLIVCLFIPWTLRESLRPAMIIAGATVLVSMIDVSVGHAAWWVALPITLFLPFAFIPGTLVCWWRYSRFNRHFRLQFESGRYRALQHELNSARQVHDASLPAPRLDGPVRLNFMYEPMRQIGGDLLMIYPTDPTQPMRYAILFDVTGHGVAAALSVNRILGEIERLLAENPDESAEQLARALNRYVHLTLARHHLYVSALLFKIDLPSGTAQCVNAGHPTAYHIDATTRSIRPIDSTSMLLGVVGADVFEVESVTIPFNIGDAVVGYTDGASEATNIDGKMLGLRGVCETIEQTISRSRNPADWPGTISRLVIEYRLAPPQDDTIIFSLWRA